jgi:putative ABC transport system permease protein
MQDLRFALRQLLKNPGFTAVAVLTLALGIGFVTTLFTMINGVAFGRLPFEDSERIVSIGVPATRFDEFARQQQSCEAIAFASPSPRNLKAGPYVSRYPAAAVSDNFLDVLRARPAMGRGFLPEDGAAGAPLAVLIGHSVWEREFERAADVVGRTVEVKGEVGTVVGVMPAGFGFPFHEEMWIPRRVSKPVPGGFVFGRLRAGSSPAIVSAEMAAIGQRLKDAGPDTFVWDADAKTDADGKVRTVEVVPFAQRGVKDALRQMLAAILGATFIVLLLACANVANLFLARSVDRRKEMAIRAALGASRPRLIRQMLLESLLVAILGAGGGLWIASLGTRWIWGYAMTERPLTGGAPFWMNFDVDGAVFLFVAAVALLAALLTGLVPALKAARIDPNEALKEGGGGQSGSRFTGLLVNGQMAFSVCLVASAGLFATVLVAFNHKTLPYDPASIYTARIALDASRYDDAETRRRFFAELATRLGTVPGIAAAEWVSPEALRMVERPQTELEGAVYGRDGDRPRCVLESVSPHFLAGYGVALLRGRELSADDTADSPPVAVVNAAFADRFGREIDVVGRRFRFVADGAAVTEWITVVGVVPDLGSMKAGESSRGPVIYRPLAQNPYRAMTLLVRAQGDPSRFTAAIRSAVATLDPGLPVAQLQTVQAIIEMERVGMNMFGVLFLVCGVGALSLAGVGLYGVVSLGVRRRTREFGVRLSIGATRGDLLRLVVRQGLRRISVGLGAGALLSAGAFAGLRALLPGFTPSSYDVWIYAGAAVLLATVGGAALIIPARRAAQTNPMEALRAE